MYLLGILYWNKLRNRKRLQFIAYQLNVFMTYNKAIVKIPTHVHHYLVWMMDFVHLSMKMVSNAIVQMVLLVIPVPKSSPQLQGWFSFCAALWPVLLDWSIIGSIQKALKAFLFQLQSIVLAILQIIMWCNRYFKHIHRFQLFFRIRIQLLVKLFVTMKAFVISLNVKFTYSIT